MKIVCDGLPRYCVGRGIHLLEVLVVLLGVAWFDSGSLMAQALTGTGDAGWVLVVVVAFGCLMGLADVIVNDLMAARYAMPTAKAWRHVGLGLIGISLAALGFVVIYHHGFLFVVLAYWLNALIAVGLMLMDLFARRGGD